MSSNPFQVFRKHQKKLLVVFGVLLIGVFTIGDVLLSMSGKTPASEDEVVVTWDGGELTRNQLAVAHDMRSVVAQFLQRAQQMSIGRGAYAEEYKRAMQTYFQTGQFVGLPVEPIISEESVDRDGNEGTVRSFLLAQEASNLGFVVTDGQITDYLLRLVDNKVPGPELSRMIEGPSGRFTEKSFYDVLRREMLAERLFQEVSRTGAAMPPAQRFDYYVRLFRQVSLEALAIPVEQFADQASEPTESELTAYFDKYKAALPPKEFFGNVTLDSPDPGFKLPHRVSIEYIKGVADSFMDEVRDEVNDADILAYYEEEKLRDEQLQQDELPLPKLDDFGPDQPEADPDKRPATTDAGPESKDTPDAKDKPDAKDAPAPKANDAPAPKANDAPDTEGKPNTKGTTGTEQAPESKDAPAAPDPAVPDPAESPKTGEKDCQDSGDADTVDSADPPADKAEPKQPAAGEPPVSAPKEAIDSAETPATVNDAADAQPVETQPAATQPAETKSGETKTAEPAPAESSEENPAETEPAATDPAETDLAETEPAETKKPGEETTADKDTPDGAETSDAADSRKREIKFKPLDEVRDYIRGRLTEQRAADRLQQRLAEIRARMENYHTARVQANVGKEPTPPDLKSLAVQGNFDVSRRDLLSLDQYDETTDIGKSHELIPQADGRPPQQIQFERTAFQKGEQSLYRAYQTQDDDGYHYLYWKTAEADEEVPKLDAIRETVVKAWKLGAGVEDESNHARGMALARAEQLAGQLRAGATFEQLADEQPGSTVINTGMFSWLTFGQLNQVDGIDQAGVDFMRAVFQLAPGEVTVAVNHPQTFVYVVRVKAENKTPQTLQQNYLDEMESPMIQYQLNMAQRMDQMLAHQRWFEDIERKLKLKWEKPELRDIR